MNVERSVSGQPWRWRRSGEPGITPDALVDELLLARGVERDDLARHRNPTIRDFLPDPSCFQDMDKGAKRLADAVEGGESIAIFGDYDVDGATSAALLVLLLRRLGAEPIVYIPDRLMEGYGPSGKALVELKQRGASLAVCVDCGAQAFEALEEAKAAELDVIVVDHHQCASLLPVAFAMINPNRLDESAEGAAHGHLAAVGMAFLLGVALLRELRAARLFRRRRDRAEDHRPARPRRARHRRRCRAAEVAQPRVRHPGAEGHGRRGRISASSALAEAARLVKPPSCRDLGFALGPRINAGGRVGKSDLGVRLLTSTDPEEARTIAAELDRLNEERRAIEMLVTEQAEAQAEEQADAPVILVMSGGWHQGVIGIVAGRLKERFGRPAIVIAECEDGTGKGSGRSISGVDLGAAVLAAKDSGLLIAGGGHAMAAGLTLPAGGLEPLRAFLNERLAADVEAARGGRALAARRPARAGRSRRRPVRRARRRRPLWRRLAGAARRRRPGAADQDQHRRRRPCPRDRLRRRRQELQVDRLPQRRDRARPGACSPRSATSAGGSPERSSATNGTAAMRRKCTSRTPRLLDPHATLA